MENYWQEKSLSFGTVRRNNSTILTFQALDNIPEIARITVPCNCTVPKFDKATKQLKVIYKAGEIPQQVVGNQSITKFIHIQYETGESDTLTITGTKLR